MVNKLIHLMLTDIHHRVRQAAGQTLGKTGHGKAVHDKLMELMEAGTARQRQEALSQVGNLGTEKRKWETFLIDPSNNNICFLFNILCSSEDPLEMLATLFHHHFARVNSGSNNTAKVVFSTLPSMIGIHDF